MRCDVFFDVSVGVEQFFHDWEAGDSCTDNEVRDLSGGTCDSSNACTCTADSTSQKIGDFEALECSGYNSCRSSALEKKKDHFFKFSDPSSYLLCSGWSSCRNWNVENVGAACCTNAQTCHTGSKIHMTSEPSRCTNDICCAEYEACKLSEFRGVHSLSCSGNFACDTLDVEVEREPWMCWCRLDIVPPRYVILGHVYPW